MTASQIPVRSLTVLICTHNREELLRRAIRSLNNANKPAGWGIKLLVVANACSDATHDYLQGYAQEGQPIPLDWIAEPTPGKSHALNCALPALDTALVAFVDDDHRVAPDYLVELTRAADAWPDADLLCGRIIPDWDGTEPRWVHDDGPYRIYPLPVPRYDQGDEPFPIDTEGPIPGGGNLIARLPVIGTTGPFAIELGPTGHDLGGSEDADWILRALRNGARLRYAPAVIQYHFVDSERLTLGYIARKGFQRSQSVTRVRSEHEVVPKYMWRKAAGYAARLVFATQMQARRFYLVRLAASLGEISGIHDQAWRKQRRARLPLLADDLTSYGLLALSLCALLLAAHAGRHWVGEALRTACVVGASLALLLVLKSIRDFTRTGPSLRDEILQRYRAYSLLALARLAVFALVLTAFWAFPGAMLWIAATETLGLELPVWTGMLGSAVTVLGATLYAGCRALSLNPGLIIASWQYRTARVHRLWRRLSPEGLNRIAEILGVSGVVVLGILALLRGGQGAVLESVSLLLVALGYGGILAFAIWEPDGKSRRRQRTGNRRPNIVMIGSDTLRADRIGATRNGTSITPNIDRLAARSTRFDTCYVPCARTAPSLISMLTGTWPHTHGIRDNFVADADTRLESAYLPAVLRQLGYRTAAVSDWCGADLGKFNFGFDVLDLPKDQWNLKYLIRQGPKDIRLFLSLFLHNRIGRLVLPEIYYLGGVPQTRELGRRGRRAITRLAATGDPFYLHLFYSTTHPPFASEHPYYIRYADPAYKGESKFAMARLTDPFEIIRRQGEPRAEFDLTQILDLYDGCVAHFDDEVGKTLGHLEETGLLSDTIIVLFSDHGMEFFEHGTWGQGNSAHGDFSARVPLLIANPQQAAEPRQVTQVVRTIDLLPTLLDLVRAPSIRCDGVSLLPCMIGPSTDLKLKAYYETGIWIAPTPGLPERHLSYPDLLQLLDVPNDANGTLAIKDEYQSVVLTAKDRMIRDGRWKLVYQPLAGGYVLTLYDLETDPGCTRDASHEYPQHTRRLWAELRDWMREDPMMRGDPRLADDPEYAMTAMPGD